MGPEVPVLADCWGRPAQLLLPLLRRHWRSREVNEGEWHGGGLVSPDRSWVVPCPRTGGGDLLATALGGRAWSRRARSGHDAQLDQEAEHVRSTPVLGLPAVLHPEEVDPV